MHTSLSKKLLAGLLSLVMVLSLVAPGTSAQAAAKYSLTDKKSVKSGYTFKYELKGVSKGCYVTVTRNVSGEKVVYNHNALTKTTKINGTGKTMNLYVTYGEKEENYTGKFTVRVYGKKTNKLYKTLVEEVTVKVPEKEKLDVTSVTATGFNTLAITGTKLSELTTADVVMEGNTVTAINVSEDEKSAVVTLETALPVDTEKKVTILGKEFTIKFVILASEVAIIEKTYDDDTANQYCLFTINGSQTNALDLIANGYTVKFEAWTTSDVDVTGTVFDNTSTGKFKTITLATEKDEYVVRVTVQKGTDVLVSDKQTIAFANLDVVTSGFDGIYFDITTGKPSDNLTAAAASDTAIGHYADAANKMVVGEELTLGEVDLNIEGFIGEYTSGSEFNNTVLTSSNPNVVSVDAATKHVLHANSEGTANITATYGNYSETFSVTVTNAKRDLADVKTSVTTKKLALGTASSVRITTFDSLGDRATGIDLDLESTDSSIFTVGSTAETGTKGYVDITLTPVAVGKASLLVKYLAKDGTTRMTSVTVVVSNAGGANYKVEMESAATSEAVYAGTFNWQLLSENSTLDYAGKKYAEYSVNKYSNDGIYTGTLQYTASYTGGNASEYVVELSTSLYVGVSSAGTNNALFTATNKPGKTTATFYLNDAAKTKLGQVTFTTVDNTACIKGLTFKSVNAITSTGISISLPDFVTLESTGNDPILRNVVLSKTTAAKVRVASNGQVYLDTNGNGSYDVASDVNLGTLSMTTLSDCNFSVVSNAYTSVTGHKGTICVKLTAADTTTVIASTTVSVKVNGSLPSYAGSVPTATLTKTGTYDDTINLTAAGSVSIYYLINSDTTATVGSVKAGTLYSSPVQLTDNTNNGKYLHIVASDANGDSVVKTYLIQATNPSSQNCGLTLQ